MGLSWRFWVALCGHLPHDACGVAIRHFSATINRKPFLGDHPKMKVDPSDPDDREYVARTIWRYSRPTYVGVLPCMFHMTPPATAVLPLNRQFVSAGRALSKLVIAPPALAALLPRTCSR